MTKHTLYMNPPVHKEELQQRNCLGMVNKKTAVGRA